MCFKEYLEYFNNEEAKPAEALIHGITRGGKILNGYFYYSSGCGCHSEPISECSNLKELRS